MANAIKKRPAKAAAKTAAAKRKARKARALLSLPPLPVLATPWAAATSLATWRSATPRIRARLATELALALGAPFRPGARAVGKEKLIELIHVPTELRFVLVPGGAFVAGMRADDLARARALEFDDDETLATLVGGPAAKPAAVGAFLCARTPLLEGHARGLRAKRPIKLGRTDAVVAFTRAQADSVVALLPGSFRHLSQIEWEYVARSGGTTTFINGETPYEARAACEELHDERFDPAEKSRGSNTLGVWGLPWGEWVGGKNARHAKAACGGAAMSLPWVSGDAIVGCFAGLSVVIGAETASCVRVAVDLPR